MLINPQKKSKLKKQSIIIGTWLQVLNVACSEEITKNNLTGSLRLNDFNATMKMSKIGEFQSNYVQVS